MFNYTFAFGPDITLAAVRLGQSRGSRSLRVWPIGLAGGLLLNVGYSVYLLCRNATTALFRLKCPDILWAIFMAILWMGAFALYRKLDPCDFNAESFEGRNC
jgi:L-rhamnose-H+ transport protein